MGEDSNVQKFIVINDTFKRYTVVLDIINQETSAFCDECDEKVFSLSGDHISTQSKMDLFEMIVEEHDKQKHGELVSFEESWEETFQ
jgi:hypothetical protein